jgi:hypothetical protein
MGCVLSCGVALGVEGGIGAIDGLESELLGTAVVVLQSKNFADHTAAWFTFHMDHVIYGLADLRFDVLEGGL